MPVAEITKRATTAVTNSVIPAGQEHRYRQGGTVTTDFLKMDVDESNMYIKPLVITSGSEDRDGEVVEPDGVNDIEYRKNPLVFFNHSHKFDPSIFPCGTSETPDRKYQCMRQGDVWVAGCRFTPAAKIGEQVFALVLDGVIRGRSIGGLTHDMAYYNPQAPGKAFVKGTIVPVRKTSVRRTLLELVEWSWVPIQSNRDVVTSVKSILSHGRYNGQSLDPSVRMVFKSLDLSEPETSSKNGRKSPHEKCGWDALLPKGIDMADKGCPVAIRFDTKHFPPGAARKFLREHSDMFEDTELTMEKGNSGMVLRSTQVSFSGETESETDERYPGIELVFVKAGFFDKSDAEPEEEPETKPEGGIVEQIVEDRNKGAVVVEEAGSGTAEKPAAEAIEDAAKVVAAKAASGPRGSQWLKSYMQKLGEILDMAEASQTELEPEMVSKCGEFNEMARSLIGKIGEYHKDRYEAATAGEKKEMPEEEPAEDKPNANMTKSAKIDAFLNGRVAVPGFLMTAIRDAGSFLEGDAPSVDRAREILAGVTKGYVEPAKKPAAVVNEDLARKNAERARRLRLRG